MITLLPGDCREVMATLEPDSIDAIVTDPPYGLTFMGKGWDHGVPGIPFWSEAIRVLKPGGHLLAFGGTRTFHRLTCAIEDAGFEIRDCLSWLYGSGFPKSHNLPGGLGTALKPAWEPIILARKPLVGTVAANVERHGTGALNIDGCRIETNGESMHGSTRGKMSGAVGSGFGFVADREPLGYHALGRWPANVLLDEDAAALLDASVKPSQSRIGQPRKSARPGNGYGMTHTGAEYSDSGGPSRFFLTVSPDCWLCYGPKHSIMSATQGGASCDYAANVESDSHPSELANGSARARVQGQRPLDCEGNNQSNDRLAHNAVTSLTSGRETTGSTALASAPTSPVDNLAQRVKSAGNLCDSCATAIAHALARAKPSHDHRLLLGLDSISERRRQILNNSLVRYAETLDSTGTIPTTEILTMWFGYVRDAIASSIPTDATATASDLTRWKYSPKASRAERNAGLDGMPERVATVGNLEAAGRNGANPANYVGGEQRRVEQGLPASEPRANHHPTVKPVALMRWLVRLVTPPGGVVLDPFMGSGTTGIASAAEGFRFIGIEQDVEYLEIARRRIAHAQGPLLALAAD